MAEIKISEGQSLLDVSLWLLGGTAGLFALADANGLAITDALEAGQVLVVPDGFPVSAELVAYYKGEGWVVNTANIRLPPVVASKKGDWSLIDFKNSDFLN